ncbi:MAG: hypothetical protein KKC03_06615 [Bacteroidetes bacterium]|nr:hypothetical protein [Bacteroidota bacterium]
MKLTALLLFISLATYAQVDTTFPRNQEKPNLNGYEEGSITFTKSLYGLSFDRYVDRELQAKLKRFMFSNRHIAYRGIGTFTLKLVRKNGQIYVVERERPYGLILLE